MVAVPLRLFCLFGVVDDLFYQLDALMLYHFPVPALHLGTRTILPGNEFRGISKDGMPCLIQTPQKRRALPFILLG